MGIRIEDQMHQFLINKEETRCRALEKKSGKKVKRKNIEKPWTRMCQSSLCQEPEFLVMVEKYDYDLRKVDFKKYCGERGVLHVAGEEGSKRWGYFLNFDKSKSEYLKDPFFQYSQEKDGKKYQYKKEEMETGWKIIKIGRAKIQDCWEIYSKKS